MTTSAYDSDLLAAGDGHPLSPEALIALATEPDILRIGMLADDSRRRRRGRQVTYAFVATVPMSDTPGTAQPAAMAEVAPEAVELRLTGSPDSVAGAVDAVRAATSVAAGRTVSGFSLRQLVELAGMEGLLPLLQALREAGLTRVAEVPVDTLEAPEQALEALGAAGFREARLTLDRARAGQGRADAVLLARRLCARFPFITAVAPLPMLLNAFRPTTGYEDVRAVALARLALPAGIAVQVDWLRYGPKLAQVALMFGADDLDNVPPVTAGVEGPRRGTVVELRRNIEAAGFEPVARQGPLAP